ncbi:response regulator [Bifidobacterium sp.]|uniref:response regulator n=1 Tax=Bifidobacterium sp. TaxID=41200 RepID=UPI0039EA2F04
MRILIADDDPQFLKALHITLRSQGYDIVSARDGIECIRVAAQSSPGMLILDLGMPRMDGMGVIQAVRGWTTAPILVVSGRASEREKVEALDAGADDYVIKPVFIEELLARIRALERRIDNSVGENEEPLVRIGDVTVDLGAHSIYKAHQGREIGIKLTPTEWKMLDILVRNRGKLVTRQDMLTHIWGSEHISDSGYLRLYMSQLRKKIEENPSEPTHLLTETGMGYRLVL